MNDDGTGACNARLTVDFMGETGFAPRLQLSDVMIGLHDASPDEALRKCEHLFEILGSLLEPSES